MATVITFSPNVPLADTERLVRTRLARDGVVELAAKTADQRQRRQLGRFARRLADDERLWVFRADRPDGATYVTVLPAGQQRAIWWSGDPKIDAPAESPNYWSAPDEPQAD